MLNDIGRAMVLSALLTASPALAQITQDPFPQLINTTDGVVKVSFAEFASLPDVNGQAARMMMLVDEPGTRAMIGGLVYRDRLVPQLTGLLLFGDNPSGELFCVNADKLPNGGQDSIRRILSNDRGESKNLLSLIREKSAAQGKQAASRADLRFGIGPGGQIFLLNKRDGTIRLLAK